MSKPFTLQPLLDLAQVKNDHAAKRLADIQNLAKTADERLTLLLQYRAEYQTKFRETVRQGLDSNGWRNFHQFMDQLDGAVAQQRLIVAQTQDRIHAAKREWQDKRRELKSYSTLAERHVKAEKQASDKREQKEFDALATTTWLRTRQAF